MASVGFPQILLLLIFVVVFLLLFPPTQGPIDQVPVGFSRTLLGAGDLVLRSGVCGRAVPRVGCGDYFRGAKRSRQRHPRNQRLFERYNKLFFFCLVFFCRNFIDVFEPFLCASVVVVVVPDVPIFHFQLF